MYRSRSLARETWQHTSPIVCTNRIALMGPLRRIFLILLLGVFATSALAGGYGSKKYLKKQIPKEQRYYNFVPAPLRKQEELPRNFDWGNIDGVSYLTPSWNQHIPQYCGSCYLHAALSMVQDRLKIKNQGRNLHGTDVMLGRQTFLNCAPLKGFSNGCDGGDVIDVFQYMQKHGLPDESCMPYSASDYRMWTSEADTENKRKHDECPVQSFCTNCMPDPKHPGSGHEVCWPIKSPVLYKVSSYGQLDPTVEAMMSEIYYRGPISCGISVPDDFVYSYDDRTIYNNTVDTDVDHDIEIVGWGEEDGVPYWRCRNSWGTYWGKLSFFRVVRGVNSNQIERDCWAADPTNEMEVEVEEGLLIGSMYGVHKPKDIDPYDVTDTATSLQNLNPSKQQASAVTARRAGPQAVV